MSAPGSSQEGPVDATPVEMPDADAMEQRLPTADDDLESPPIDEAAIDPDTVEANLADVADQLRVEPIDPDA